MRGSGSVWARAEQSDVCGAMHADCRGADVPMQRVLDGSYGRRCIAPTGRDCLRALAGPRNEHTQSSLTHGTVRSTCAQHDRKRTVSSGRRNRGCHERFWRKQQADQNVSPGRLCDVQWSRERWRRVQGDEVSMCGEGQVKAMPHSRMTMMCRWSETTVERQMGGHG